MINLSTGKQKFDFLLDGEKEVSIYFNPADPALFERMKDFHSFLKEKEKEIGEKETIGADGHATAEDAMAKEKKLRDEFCAELDKAFNANISKELFQNCSPFASVNGNFFVSEFLNAIIPEIKKRNEEEAKKTEKNIQKHIAKYKKQKCK